MKSASCFILWQLALTKSSTGPTLPGKAHPTQVSPLIGKARACARRAALEVTDAPSSLSDMTESVRHGFLDCAFPPNAALAITSAPLSASERTSSSSMSSYSMSS